MPQMDPVNLITASSAKDTRKRPHKDQIWSKQVGWDSVHKLLANPFDWAATHGAPIAKKRSVVVLDPADSPDGVKNSCFVTGVKGAAFVLARGQSASGGSARTSATGLRNLVATAAAIGVTYNEVGPIPTSEGFSPTEITLCVADGDNNPREAFAHFHLPTRSSQHGYDRLAGFTIACATQSDFLPEFFYHHRSKIKIQGKGLDQSLLGTLDFEVASGEVLRIASERVVGSDNSTNGCAICSGVLHLCPEGEDCKPYFLVDWIVFKCYRQR